MKIDHCHVAAGSFLDSMKNGPSGQWDIPYAAFKEQNGGQDPKDIDVLYFYYDKKADRCVYHIKCDGMESCTDPDFTSYSKHRIQ